MAMELIIENEKQRVKTTEAVPDAVLDSSEDDNGLEWVHKKPRGLKQMRTSKKSESASVKMAMTQGQNGIAQQLQQLSQQMRMASHSSCSSSTSKCGCNRCNN